MLKGMTNDEKESGVIEEKPCIYHGLTGSLPVCSDLSIDIRIPRGFYNIGISLDNCIFGDTNESSRWRTFRVPLPVPDGKWIIESSKDMRDCIALHLTDK